MKHHWFSLFGIFLLVAGCGPVKHLDDKVVWQKFDTVAPNFPAAPSPGSKPIFIYFSQDKCHYCEQMDSLFARPEVAWYINEHFLPVKVNVDTDLPLRTRGEEITYDRLFSLFKMDGFPSYYFFDTTGQIMGMLERTMELVMLKQSLMYVNDRHFGKTRFDEFLKMDDVPTDTTYGVF